MNIYKLWAMLLSSLFIASCAPDVEDLIAEGKYKEAETVIKKTKGYEKYDYAEMLINEYIELEEYDRAVYVYEKITPEHCRNKDMQWPTLYCHGAGKNYETNVAAIFRKTFMAAGDYDKVWQYSVWESDGDSGYDAEAYYKFMSDVILYLCSTGDKTEAHRFLNRYVFWFDTNIDNNSYYSTENPGFLCDVVKSKLQRIINTY